MSTPTTPIFPTAKTDEEIRANNAEVIRTGEGTLIGIGHRPSDQPLPENLVSQPTVEVPNPAPGTGPQGSATITAVDPVNNVVEITAHPQATAPAHPAPDVQASAPGSAPDSLPNDRSHVKGEKGGPTAPSIDTKQFDDAGNPKTDQGVGGEGFGPRGKDKPADIMTDDERKAVSDAADQRLSAGMSSTTGTDSAGSPKGRFAVIPQGLDKHGARIPDKIDTSKVVEAAPASVGPRGAGAPQDCFHGPRPEIK